MRIDSEADRRTAADAPAHLRRAGWPAPSAPTWRLGLLVLAAALARPVLAQSPATPPATASTAPSTPLHSWPDADLAHGEALIRQHGCNFCHARKFGGDGHAVYRPQGRIGSPSALLTMVETCNTELNLGLFPEDVTAVAAVLQRDHYRFPRSEPPAGRR